MPSGGDQSPPPPPPPPAAAASDEEEEEEDDGQAEDAAQPAESPTPQIQQRFDELCGRLNMDEAARAEAWGSYRSISESYTLETHVFLHDCGEVHPGLPVALGGNSASLEPVHEAPAALMLRDAAPLQHGHQRHVLEEKQHRCRERRAHMYEP
ncbi:retinoblastoma-like protein 2 [Eulemur rufifrons]|uniref:retinoblastoma-like protein 2 n=1 Tax=Eulemur rufifrons TaxID=859984 RepID=UPI0037449FFD